MKGGQAVSDAAVDDLGASSLSGQLSTSGTLHFDRNTGNTVPWCEPGQTRLRCFTTANSVSEVFQPSGSSNGVKGCQPLSGWSSDAVSVADTSSCDRMDPDSFRPH